MNRLRNRLAAQEGFTLIELLVVIVIIGILAAIAIPSYLSFVGNANTQAMNSSLQQGVVAAESWAANNSGSYTSLTTSGLKTEDAGLSSYVTLDNTANSGANYCLKYVNGSTTGYVYGPGGSPTTTKPASCT